MGRGPARKAERKRSPCSPRGRGVPRSRGRARNRRRGMRQRAVWGAGGQACPGGALGNNLDAGPWGGRPSARAPICAAQGKSPTSQGPPRARGNSPGPRPAGAGLWAPRQARRRLPPVSGPNSLSPEAKPDQSEGREGAKPGEGERYLACVSAAVASFALSSTSNSLPLQLPVSLCFGHLQLSN